MIVSAIRHYFEGSLQVIDVKDLKFIIYSMPTDIYGVHFTKAGV